MTCDSNYKIYSWADGKRRSYIMDGTYSHGTSPTNIRSPSKSSYRNMNLSLFGASFSAAPEQSAAAFIGTKSICCFVLFCIVKKRSIHDDTPPILVEKLESNFESNKYHDDQEKSCLGTKSKQPYLTFVFSCKPSSTSNNLFFFVEPLPLTIDRTTILVRSRCVCHQIRH
jgi:hypothetical protein